MPNILQTDNGLEFVNKLIKTFCEEHNITFIQYRPRNPKCNGIVEVSHKEIRKYVLTKYALCENDEEEVDKDFDLKEILLDSCFIHNSNVHTSTKMRPLDLIKNSDKNIIYLKLNSV